MSEFDASFRAGLALLALLQFGGIAILSASILRHTLPGRAVHHPTRPISPRLRFRPGTFGEGM